MIQQMVHYKKPVIFIIVEDFAQKKRNKNWTKVSPLQPPFSLILYPFLFLYKRLKALRNRTIVVRFLSCGQPMFDLRVNSSCLI